MTLSATEHLVGHTAAQSEGAFRRRPSPDSSNCRQRRYRWPPLVAASVVATYVVATPIPKFRSLKVRSAVSGRDASCRINGFAETPERFHENAVVSRLPTYGFNCASYACYRRNMYTRISRSGGRSYLQIVESFRTDTGAVRQRVIANLGRL